MSITVSSSPMELLHVSHCLLWLLDAFFIATMEFLHVSHWLFQFHEVSITVIAACLWVSPQPHRIAACFSLPPFVAGCLSLSIPVSRSYCMYLTRMKLLHVSHCLSLLLAVSHCFFQCHSVAACLSLSPIVDCSLTHFLSGPMELLHFSHCLPWLLHGSICFLSQWIC